MRRTPLPPSELPLIERLKKAKSLGCFAPSQLPFVDSLIAGHEKWGSWTVKQEASVENMLEVARQEYRRRREAAAAPKPNGHAPTREEPSQYAKLWELFMRSTKGKKDPVLRLKLDNGHIAKITRGKPEPERGYPDPSLWVNTGIGWVARISRDGRFVGRERGEASIMATVAQDALATARAVRAFLADPAGYATAYGHGTGSCMFCGTTIEHPSSLKRGYGPICAANWGLPHEYNDKDWLKKRVYNEPKSTR